MKVLVFGLTGFGNSALKALKRAGITPIALVTKKEKGVFPYYEEENISLSAKKYNIPVYEDMDFEDQKTLKIFKDLSPDLILVSSFNNILPSWLISIPKHGVINTHPSLLPRYRGATPTAWAIIMGESQAGVTLHYLTKKIDSGDIISQKNIPIDINDTDGVLRKKLSAISEDMIYDFICLLKEGKEFKSYPQDEKNITYFPKITKRDGFIKFDEPSLNVHNRIRGMNPYPGSYTIYNKKEYSIVFSQIIKEAFEGMPGLIIKKEDGFLIAKTKDGALKIKTNPEIANIENAVLGKESSDDFSGYEEDATHTRKMYGIENGAEDFPKMVVVSVTYICNAKCPHCPYTENNSDLRKSYKDALYIPPELFRKIADECGKFHSYIRITGGGEPLLHKDMVPLIEYAKSVGSRVWLNTNGSLFTGKAADRLLACGIDFIEFSVDAADEETYKKVRPGIDFNKLVSNIKYVIEKRNSSKYSARIAVSVINQKIIKDKIDGITKFWLKLGVDEVIKRKFLTWGSTTEINPDNSADPSPYLIKEKGIPCPYPFHRLNIDTRGKVEVCGFDIAGRTNFGNVNKQSIQEIWKGPDFDYWRKMHLEGRGGELPLCRECPDWQYRSWNYNWERVLKTSEIHRQEALDTR